jgi:translation initiation factor 2 alpha subunit (eIF-2alpha)
MRKAEAAGNDECPVKIKLVAPPLYVLTTQTLDKVLCKSSRVFYLILYYIFNPVSYTK